MIGKNAVRWLMVLVVFSLLAVGVAGCAPEKPVEDITIKVAVLPILDTLPLYVAQEAGYFTAQGVKVELIPAASAAERDQLIAAGQADVMVNDPVAVALINRDQVQVQIVRTARAASAGAPLYRVLAAPGNEFKTISDLAGVPVGISQGSIIDYMTDYLLKAGGLAADQIQTLAVPKIPDRMALLLSGELKAATLPEPFSTMAVQQGAVVLADDTAFIGVGSSVVSVRKSVIDEHPEAVRAFLKAWEQAVDALNKEPEKWRETMGKNKLVPEPLLANYPVPQFVTAGVPSQADFDAAAKWALDRGLVQRQALYAECVTDALIK